MRMNPMDKMVEDAWATKNPGLASYLGPSESRRRQKIGGRTRAGARKGKRRGEREDLDANIEFFRPPFCPKKVAPGGAGKAAGRGGGRRREAGDAVYPNATGAGRARGSQTRRDGGRKRTQGRAPSEKGGALAARPTWTFSPFTWMEKAKNAPLFADPHRYDPEASPLALASFSWVFSRKGDQK